MATKAVLISALFATLSLGLPSSSSGPVPRAQSVVHERRSLEQYSPWQKRERVPQDEVLELRISLAQQNVHLGHDLLMEVSDPQSAKYGQHWSADEVAKLFAPSDETIDAAVSWITSTLDIDPARISVAPGKGWLSFHPSVAEAEALFGTEYWLYEHEDEGQLAAGVEHYSVPHDLQEHIDFIFPGVTLGELKPRDGSRMRSRALKNKPRDERSPRQKAPKTRRQAPTNATCAELVTPACIKALYGLPTPDKANANNSLGLYETQSWYQFRDLDLFYATYFPEIPEGTRPLNLSIDQAEWFYDDPDDPYVTFASEADLDVQVAWPIVYPQTVTVYQVDDVYYNLHTNTLGSFNTFLDALDGSYCNYSAYGETGDNPAYDAVYPDDHVVTSADGNTTYGTWNAPEMCGVYKPTNVISISYGRAETSFTAAYQKRQCDEFLKLGLMGTSIIVASGDSGPLAARACQASNLGQLHVQSTSNCPYVTSVGATQLLANGTERAVQSDDWASSGGFSNIFATPDYQQTALATYLAGPLPASLAGAYNVSGRGVPDVAAVGASIATVVDGELTPSDGTSAAAPLFAAMLGLVNEERLAAGKAAVGFVNPVLYANAEAIFTDITVGNSDMCGGLQPGFEAVEGWDPVTGLGTAQWEGLRDVLMALP